MITYLLNFVLCSGLLLLVYRLLLGNENLYRFNRFYLLFSLVFSLIVPGITMEIPAKFLVFKQQLFKPATKKILPTVQQNDNTTFYQSVNEAPVVVAPPVTDKYIYKQITPAPEVDSTGYVMPSIYALIAIVLLLRFARNLYVIKRSVIKNTVESIDGGLLILVDDEVTPHSFLRYVFVNKKEYRDGLIAPEIICHEQTHIRQLHSVDVIVVELLQAVCWFNPLIPLYRKAIQLNHEFLADEAVVKSYDDTPAYQYLLLAKASQHCSLYITSQFNYLTTKKRLIMMTKNTSEKIALYKRLALAPVLAGAVLLFSHKSMAEAQPVNAPDLMTTVTKQQPVQGLPAKLKFNHKPIPASAKDARQAVLDEFAAILKKYNQPATNKQEARSGKSYSQADKWRLEVLFSQMSQAQQKDQYIVFSVPGPPPAKSHPTEKQLTDWQDGVKYGVWIDDKRVKNTDLANYKPSDFDHVFFSRLMPVAVKNDKFHFQVDLLTPAGYTKLRKEILDKDDWEVWHKMKMDKAVGQVNGGKVNDAEKDFLKQLPKREKAITSQKQEDDWKALMAYRQTDEGKKKAMTARVIVGKTVTVKITGTYKNDKGGFRGILAEYEGNEYLINTWYGQTKELNDLLKIGDVVTIKVYGSGIPVPKDEPIAMTPGSITKDGKKIFQLAEADKLPDYPFLSETNKVHFADGQISNIEKDKNGRWRKAMFETVNGYVYELNFKQNTPDMGNIVWGDHIRLRFVNEVKTRAKKYKINDWISISTYKYKFKNPDLAGAKS